MSDAPVGYMQRTRDYYRALGYEKDYVWSHYDDVPFARLGTPLARATIGIVTTSSPLDRGNKDDKGVKHVWSMPTENPPERLYTHDLAWDKDSTHTRDRESFVPIRTLQGLARAGVIGGVAGHFHGIPTEYSQRKTIEEDAPALVERLRSERSDGVLLFPI